MMRRVVQSDCVEEYSIDRKRCSAELIYPVNNLRPSSFSYDGCIQARMKEKRHQERNSRRQASQLVMVRDSIRDLSYWWLEIRHHIYCITSAISYERRTELHHRLLSEVAMEVCLQLKRRII